MSPMHTYTHTTDRTAHVACHEGLPPALVLSSTGASAKGSSNLAGSPPDPGTDSRGPGPPAPARGRPIGSETETSRLSQPSFTGPSQQDCRFQLGIVWGGTGLQEAAVAPGIIEFLKTHMQNHTPAHMCQLEGRCGPRLSPGQSVISHRHHRGIRIQ